MKTNYLGLTYLLLSVGAFAQMPDPADIFKQLDTNGDGFLSKEEAAAMPFPIDFAKADTNKDGKLSPEEFVAYMKLMMANGPPGGGPPGGGPPGQ